MFEYPDPLSIDHWLTDIYQFILETEPELLPIFNVYTEEARFGRRYIAADLRRLAPGATILEVGAGPLLLSCQLVREGFQVMALDPIDGGFSHFQRMRELVLNRAEILGCLPHLLDQAAETLSEPCRFDYAFSINVMEHVRDVALAIDHVGRSLKHDAMFRFTCANYLFPYEPHFNIPTLFSKRLTEKLLGSRIYQNKNIIILDPEVLWNSLNWINVIQVIKITRHMPELRVVFHRHLLIATLERVTMNQEFAMRRSRWMRVMILALVRLRLHYLAWLVPAIFQPIMDCTITKKPFSRDTRFE